MSINEDIQQTNDGPVKFGENVKFGALYNNADSKEDNTFSEYTPSASFEMFVTNKALFGKFELGKAYYFDITECQ